MNLGAYSVCSVYFSHARGVVGVRRYIAFLLFIIDIVVLVLV